MSKARSSKRINFSEAEEGWQPRNGSGFLVQRQLHGPVDMRNEKLPS